MITTYAKIIGFFLLAIGFLGYIPAIAPDGMLFDIFRVNGLHNLFHLLSGGIFLVVGFSENWDLSRKVTLLFAVIYGLITLMGFISSDGVVMGMPMNMADNVLHLAITVSALLFGLPQRYAMPR